MNFKSWLWPDRIIYKRESRRLRDEHNALVNICAEMEDALGGLLSNQWVGENAPDGPGSLRENVRKAKQVLAKVRGDRRKSK